MNHRYRTAEQEFQRNQQFENPYAQPTTIELPQHMPAVMTTASSTAPIEDVMSFTQLRTTNEVQEGIRRLSKHKHNAINRKRRRRTRSLKK